MPMFVLTIVKCFQVIVAFKEKMNVDEIVNTGKPSGQRWD